MSPVLGSLDKPQCAVCCPRVSPREIHDHSEFTSVPIRLVPGPFKGFVRLNFGLASVPSLTHGSSGGWFRPHLGGFHIGPMWARYGACSTKIGASQSHLSHVDPIEAMLTKFRPCSKNVRWGRQDAAIHGTPSPRKSCGKSARRSDSTRKQSARLGPATGIVNTVHNTGGDKSREKSMQHIKTQSEVPLVGNRFRKWSHPHPLPDSPPPHHRIVGHQRALLDPRRKATALATNPVAYGLVCDEPCPPCASAGDLFCRVPAVRVR